MFTYQNLITYAGKYDLVVLDPTNVPKAAPAPPPAAALPSRGSGGKGKGKGKAAAGAASALDPKTEALVDWILSNDMFKEAMANVNLDINKLPLGSLLLYWTLTLKLNPKLLAILRSTSSPQGHCHCRPLLLVSS